MRLSMLCVYWFVDSTNMANKDEYNRVLNDVYIYIFIHHQMVATYTYTHNQKTENN